MRLGRVAGSKFNRIASRAMKRARDESGLNQADFAAALSDVMGLRGKARFKQSTLSGWERGNRQVSAGALIAAASIAGISLSAALGDVANSDLAERIASLEKAVGAEHRLGPVARAIAKSARRSAKS